MKTWIIKALETHKVEYYIEAETEEEARQKFDDGDVNEFDEVDSWVDAILSVKEDEE